MKLSKESRQKLNALLSKVGVQLSEDGQKMTFAATGKLDDGTEIMTPTAWEVGAECYQSDADGNPVAVPDGSYNVDGKLSITVASGKIAEVSDIKEEAQDTEMSEELTQVISGLADRISALEADKANLSQELAATKKSLSDKETELVASKAQVAQLSKEAAAKSVTDTDAGKTKTNLSKDEKPVQKGTVQLIAEKISEITSKQ